MNILITGCNGFLGNELKAIKNHTLFPINRQILDLCNFSDVKQYIESNNIDCVLHCAIKGGRRTKEDEHKDYYENIIMFENLIHNIDKLKIFINYDSAASYNRTDGINGVREKDFSSSSVPKDFYGSSKYTIAKRVLQTDKSYNLRIFNCFGVNETSERMIKSNINRYIDKQELVIHTNKIMDFFDIDDLVKVTQHYIDNYDDNLPKDLNLCYKQKTSLIDVVNMINTLDTYRVDVKVENYNTDFNYYGHSDYLEHLPIELDGLYCGIQKMFIYLKEKK